MPYLTKSELLSKGFKSLGEEVKISDKVSLYDCQNISVGNHVRIDDFCVLSGKIELGDYVFIGVFSNIAGGEEGIEIRDFTTISYAVHIFAQSDDYTGYSMTGPEIPVKYKKEIKKKIVIEKHVVIGAGAMILPGVTLKEGTSIGSKSLITKSTESWTIYKGIPGKAYKERNQKVIELSNSFLEDMYR